MREHMEAANYNMGDNTTDFFTPFTPNGTYGNTGDSGNGGPPSVNPITVVFVCMYGLICVAGLVGNGLVILVIIRYAKMKTVTNMYILNLSIADSLFLLGLPLIMSTAVMKTWVFGYAMCKIYFILTCINMFTGAFTLAVMSGDRFFAVCYPITSIKYRTAFFALIACALTWMVSFIFMIPVVLYAKPVGRGDRYTCTIKWPVDGPIPQDKAFVCYTLLLGFVIPVALISILYTLLLIRLRTTGPQIRSADRRRSNRKATKLVTMIIAVFIMCWLPYWAFQVSLIVYKRKNGLQPWEIYSFQVFTLLSYANSMVNPCLYAFTNDNFRESFIYAFKCIADPMMGGRRNSDFHTHIGNNNTTLGSLRDDKKNRPDNTEYEFTVLNGSSTVDQGDRKSDSPVHDNCSPSPQEESTRPLTSDKSDE